VIVSIEEQTAARDATLVRVTTVYATEWMVDGEARTEPVTSSLPLGPLATHYESAGVALPQVLGQAEHSPSTVRFGRFVPDLQPLRVDTALFVLPSGRLAATLTVEVACTPDQLVLLLEDAARTHVDIGGGELGRVLGARAGVSRPESQVLGPEHHQLVSIPDRGLGPLPEGLIRQLLYRTDRPQRPEYANVHRPVELNRDPRASTALSPYVTLSQGHPPEIENAMLVSAVLIVGATARLREIRGYTQESLRTFREAEEELRTTRAGRKLLEDLAARLGDLEGELGYGVEAAADIGSLVPSRRVEGYHRMLYRALDVASRTLVVGRMLDRLEHAVTAELTSIGSVEARREDIRRGRWSTVSWLLLAVLVPVTLVAAYLLAEGAAQEDLLDRKYWPVYAIGAGLIVASLVAEAVALVRSRRTADRDSEGRLPSRRSSAAEGYQPRHRA
jgi:hypothetical protein